MMTSTDIKKHDVDFYKRLDDKYCMNKDQKDALLGLLEFHLTTMVEQLEVDGIVYGQTQVGAVYDAAYNVLHTMENALEEQYSNSEVIN